LRTLVYNGFENKISSGAISFDKHSKEEYGDRIEYELSVIESMGFCDYFLIVQDYVNFARSKDIPVGPGRGSGAGSLVAYLTGITDVDSVEFDRIVTELPQTTYAFVALGDDEKNIAIAIKLRILFERLGYKTKIQAVVYNTDKKEALIGVKNYAGQGYDIDFIGDMKTSYSEEVIMDSEVEDKALERHKKWGSESSFWQFDYNYKSSIASAIHSSLKRECGIPGIHLAPEQREETERDNIRMLEHRRWNAYMRSEGFAYSGSIEKSSRNGLAKLHNWIVPFDELPLSEKEKDDD
jgi:hypothetical protein